jgi:hypothetical protein
VRAGVRVRVRVRVGVRVWVRVRVGVRVSVRVIVRDLRAEEEECGVRVQRGRARAEARDGRGAALCAEDRRLRPQHLIGLQRVERVRVAWRAGGAQQEV